MSPVFPCFLHVGYTACFLQCYKRVDEVFRLVCVMFPKKSGKLNEAVVATVISYEVAAENDKLR